MSQKNDDASGAALAVAGIVILAMALFAVLAFITLILSIACLLAWNKPLTIGKLTLEPKKARFFVYRGLAGAAIAPVLIGFSQLLLRLDINWDYWPYFLMGGYLAGSLVVETLLDNDGDVPANHPGPVLPMDETPPQKIAHTNSSENFRFASWDDEEERP